MGPRFWDPPGLRLGGYLAPRQCETSLLGALGLAKSRFQYLLFGSKSLQQGSKRLPRAFQEACRRPRRSKRLPGSYFGPVWTPFCTHLDSLWDPLCTHFGLLADQQNDYFGELRTPWTPWGLEEQSTRNRRNLSTYAALAGRGGEFPSWLLEALGAEKTKLESLLERSWRPLSTL